MGYYCTGCGASGVRLWRPRGVGAFAPRCRACTERAEGRTLHGGVIGHSVAALPDGSSKRWDWHSVNAAPSSVWAWWHALPDAASEQLSLFATVTP